MNEALKLKPFTNDELAAFAVNDIAYVKPVEHEGATAFASHAADGTPLTVVGTRDVAFAAVRQHGLEPLSVH